MDLGPFMKSWVLPTGNLDIRNSPRKEISPANDSSPNKKEPMYSRRAVAHHITHTGPTSAAVTDHYGESYKRTATDMRRITRLRPIIRTTAGVSTNSRPMARVSGSPEGGYKQEDPRLVNRSTRLRRRKRVSDYYYSEDDQEELNQDQTKPRVINYENRTSLPNHYQLEETINKRRNRSMSPMNKRLKTEYQQRNRSASPNCRMKFNSIRKTALSKSDHSIISFVMNDTNNPESRINSLSNETRKCIIIPKKQDIENNEHEYCNKCILALQKKLIQTEELLIIEKNNMKQLQINYQEVKEARKEDAILLAKSFTNFGRQYDRLERNLSRVLITNGIKANTSDGNTLKNERI